MVRPRLSHVVRCGDYTGDSVTSIFSCDIICVGTARQLLGCIPQPGVIVRDVGSPSQLPMVHVGPGQIAEMRNVYVNWSFWGEVPTCWGVEYRSYHHTPVRFDLHGLGWLAPGWLVRRRLHLHMLTVIFLRSAPSVTVSWKPSMFVSSTITSSSVVVLLAGSRPIARARLPMIPPISCEGRPFFVRASLAEQRALRSRVLCFFRDTSLDHYKRIDQRSAFRH